VSDWLFLLSPWVAFACLIIWDARKLRPGQVVLDVLEETKAEAHANNPFETTPDFEALITTIRQEGRAYRKEEQREDRGKQFREWITIVLIGLTFAAVCYQVFEMIKVYEPIREQAEAAKQSADATTRAADAATQQSEIATLQSNNSDRALILAQRAWVGPTIAAIEAAPEIGKPLKISIQYANSGREPALNFIYAGDVFAATAADEANGVITAKVNAAFKGCAAATTLRSGQVVFPTVANTTNNLGLTTNDEFVDQAIMDGEKTIIVDGCFVYKSFDVIRHSYFCFFFNNKKTKREGLNYCENGAGAD
jgi:hypothetical protein